MEIKSRSKRTKVVKDETETTVKRDIPLKKVLVITSPQKPPKTNSSPLHDAIKNGSIEAIHALLPNLNQLEINAKDDITGYSPLFIAVKHGHYEIIQVLLQKRADIHSKDGNGSSLLHLAVECKCKKDIIHLLLQKRADINVKDGNGCSPLHLAVEMGNKPTVLLLLQNRAEINNKHTNNTNSPLPLLTMDGIEEDEKNTENEPTKKNISSTGKKSSQKVMDLRMMTKKMEWSPLHLAAQKGQRDQVIKLLLTFKADINESDKNGLSALHLSVIHRHYENMKILLEYKADIRSAKNSNCSTFLRNNTECWSALHIAAFQGHTEAIQLLLQYKADIHETEKMGYTPLHLAIENNHIDAVKLLIEHKSDIDAKNKKGLFPLLMAAKKKQIEIVKILLNHKANIDARDRCGRNTLESSKMNYDIKQLLLLHKAANSPSVDSDTKEFIKRICKQVIL